VVIFRRVVAYVLDFVLASIIAGLGLIGLAYVLGIVSVHLARAVFALFAIPLYVFGIGAALALPTSLWGTTPGKWLMRLEVVGPRGLRLTFKEALVREIIKFLFLMMPFGLFIALAVTIANRGVGWHDRAVGAMVAPKVRRTATQKRFLNAQRRYRR